MLGFPTANIDVDSHHKLIPAEGIYAVTVNYGANEFQGMLYIGNRPTVDGINRSIEVNLFDFNKEIYGETLKINLISLLRADAKFNDLEALKQQLHKDKELALKALKDKLS